MVLDKLPQELIYEIATHLRRSRDLIALGLRSNSKQIYAACRPLLRALATEAKRRNTMIAWFGLRPTSDTCMDTLYKQLGLQEHYGLYQPLNEHDTVEFLGPLTGDLSWLGLQSDSSSKSWDLQPDSTPIYAEKSKLLSQQAKRVGVVFPKCFLTFMRSPELQDRVFSKSPSCFDLGDKLRKCLSSFDRGAGGWMIHFATRLEHSECWTLYLAPDGTHCVLYGDYDAYGCEDCFQHHDYMANQSESEQKEARAIHARGEQMAMPFLPDLAFEGCKFEEWLARYYLRNWCQCIREEGASFSSLQKIQQEYIVENYSERGYL